ncbi:tRNA-Thr(GGU) m(6)t(6)A37 methyltransferase TsaA [Rhodovulum sp. ES.010]|uniref:TrmO family methyltransferase domain-containing protein n=1 Tax=Rhodovulum sp. ES.010 TaxID=1882821 RepID=UPI00092AA663|nr:TrmO family methyltransferase [Rhodovulum sp. ES.010]SIO51994.1 tRNA-Thr(GGU) m(6)t(6)A37 methyltransferase TsaA [Rhodovulum sp. ES.010]
MAKPRRPGEVALDDQAPPDGPRLRFIGHIRSPWGPDDCPKNMRAARASGRGARIELASGYGPALLGLGIGQPLILLYWMDRARRDLLRQAPRHLDGPRGTFALRSPNRPNAIAQATVRITALDADRGTVGIDAIDCFDGTPMVDMKPWIETIDLPPAP